MKKDKANKNKRQIFIVIKPSPFVAGKIKKPPQSLKPKRG